VSRAVCCDRCGRFEKYQTLYKETDKPKWKMLQSGGPSASDPVGFESTETLLCPVCAIAFESFMKPDFPTKLASAVAFKT
jgi:hypothetical protein